MNIQTSMRMLAFIACIFSAGCASLSHHVTVMNAKPPCCRSPAEFKYEPLDVGAVVQVKLDDQSPVYKFPQGSSYFKALSLPADMTQRVLYVRSRLTATTVFDPRRYSQLFCPRATFLGARYEVLSTHQQTLVRATQSSAAGWELMAAFDARFPIPDKAAFVVLHSDPAHYGNTAVLEYTRPAFYMVGTTPVINRGGEPIHHRCGPTADAEVSLE